MKLCSFARGPGFNSQRSQFFFLSFFSRFSLIPSQSASLYIIASFEVYLIAENIKPHVLVVLFQIQYILTPSIFDMPSLYSISSLKMYFLVPKGVQHFPRVAVELNCLFPIELVIFKVSLGHLLPPPPTSSLGPCMTDPSQNDRVSCLNHELSLVCIALIFLLQK